MKFLILTLTLSSLTYAIDFKDCVGQECQNRELIDNENKGSGLLDFDDSKASNKVRPQKLYEGDKLPKQKYALKGADLKWPQLQVGQCLVDPNNSEGVYYKITKKDFNKKNKTRALHILIEKENHENSLTGKLIFYGADESAAFRKLRFFDCNQTPHLWDNKYIKKCADTESQIGNFLCTPDRFNL